MSNSRCNMFSKWIFVMTMSIVGAVHADDEPRILRTEGGGAGVLAFSPDGRQLASGGHYKDRSYLWDVGTGKTVAELSDCGSMMTSIAFSPDGKSLLTVG